MAKIKSVISINGNGTKSFHVGQDKVVEIKDNSVEFENQLHIQYDAYEKNGEVLGTFMNGALAIDYFSKEELLTKSRSFDSFLRCYQEEEINRVGDAVLRFRRTYSNIKIRIKTDTPGIGKFQDLCIVEDDSIVFLNKIFLDKIVAKVEEDIGVVHLYYKI